MARYIHTGNLIMYLDMELIENKSSPTAGYALLKLHQIINEHPDNSATSRWESARDVDGTAGTRNVRAAGEIRV